MPFPHNFQGRHCPDLGLLRNGTMDILMKFLDRKANEAAEEVVQKGTLSEDKAIPLMLKMQFNHIAHLEVSVNDRFGQINQKFEQVDKRFEQVDKRFEQVDKRFEQVDKRFEQVDKRFEQVDKRFDQVDKRFEQMERRFDQVDSRFRHMERMLIGSVTFLSFLITVMRFVK